MDTRPICTMTKVEIQIELNKVQAELESIRREAMGPSGAPTQEGSASFNFEVLRGRKDKCIDRLNELREQLRYG